MENTGEKTLPSQVTGNIPFPAIERRQPRHSIHELRYAVCSIVPSLTIIAENYK